MKRTRLFHRRMFLQKRSLTTIMLVGCVALVGGCSSPFFKKSDDSDVLSEVEADEPYAWLVGDLTHNWGLTYAKVEAIALVTELDNTGSDPPPSHEREGIVSEMLARNVRKPSQVLASPTTSLVVVRGFLPPGAKKGDPFDLEIRTMPRSETSSLRGGWLMPTRLKEMAVLGNMVHSGHEMADAFGRVLVEAEFDRESSKSSSKRPSKTLSDEASKGEKKVQLTRGRVLGGGVVRWPRPLGLVIDKKHISVKTSAAIGAAINQRFHTNTNGVKKPVATPKSDKFIELLVQPRYKHNLSRYLRVVGGIAVGESLSDRAQRLEILDQQLLDPATSARAAIRLEAIGKPAVDILKKGLQSRESEVRFYSAEALAYLDIADASEVLAEAAQNEPAFRWHALTALSVMDHLSAYDALFKLLSSTSVETRYGAFRALYVRNNNDPVVADKGISDEFRYHVIASNAQPMVHITRTRGSEIVLLGDKQEIDPPGVLNAGEHIMITSVGTDQIKVSRFAPGRTPANELCSRRLDDVIRAIVQLGGKYGQLIQFLLAAYDKGYLQSRLVINAVPRPGRFYDTRDDEPTEPDEDPADRIAEIPHRKQINRSAENSPTVNGEGENKPRRRGSVSRAANPLPELFQQRTGPRQTEPVEWEDREAAIPDGPTTPKSSKGFLGKMKRFFRGGED